MAQPVPSMVAAVNDHNWVGSAQLFNILKPQYDTTMYKVLGDQNLCGLMNELGGWNPVAGIEYRHTEEDWLHELVKCNAASAGAANAVVTLTVAAGYRYTYPTGAVSPYLVAGAVTGNPTRLQDTVRFPNGVMATITAVSGNTFDVAPDVLGQNIPAVLTTDQIIIVGNAHQEKTDQPKSQMRRVNEYANDMQILKETNESTGTALGEEIWVKVEGLNGEMGYLYYLKGQHDAYMACKNLREMSLMVGEKVTNTTLATLQPSLTKTEGLIPSVTNYGNTTTYTLNNITKGDFQIMIIDQLDKYRGSKESALYSGISLRAQIDNFVTTEMKNGGVQYGAFSGGQDQFVNMGYTGFALTGYTMHLKTNDTFNYKNILGAAGQEFVDSAVLIPMDKQVASFGLEQRKETVPTVRMNYVSNVKAGGSYSREWEEWKLGGANGTYTNGVDSLLVNWRTHFGFEIFGPKRFVYITPA